MPRESGAPGAQVFGPPNASQTSAGTNQGTATTVAGDDCFLASVGSGTGVILQAGGGDGVISNGDSANTLLVYPPSGAAFNGGGANNAVSLPAGRAMYYRFITSTIIAAVF